MENIKNCNDIVQVVYFVLELHYVWLWFYACIWLISNKIYSYIRFCTRIHFLLQVCFYFFLTHYQLDMDVEVNCTCGAGPMRLLVLRTERNYMRRFYKCPIGKV